MGAKRKSSARKKHLTSDTKFQLDTSMTPMGDQPAAIKKLVDGL
jgi:hypothetical protein